eukprot:s1589_g6.t1
MPNDGLERNKDGVPTYDGSAEKLALFREEALAYTFTLEHHKRYLAGPHLAKELTGVARTVVRRKLAQDPQWLAHPRGAYVLIDFLEQAIETPTVVQASNHIHKFFYQLRRRKGETMTEWINRHNEMMWEASRSLKRVQKEHGVASATATSWERPATSQEQPSGRSEQRHDWAREEPQSRPVPEVFDDNGRLTEDDGDGLDANERANILVAIRGDFSVKNVEKALREQWRDDGLARRDRAKHYAHVAHQEEEQEDVYAADMEAPDPSEDPCAYEAFMAEQYEIVQALEAIREKKGTLKEARWTQTQVKLNRRFYPTQGYRPPGRPTSTTSSSTSSRSVEKCLCGGKHKTSQCPVKNQKANIAEEEAEVAFSAINVEEAMPATTDRSSVDVQTIQAGKGIIDCGATSTLGSVDAIESLMDMNLDKHGKDRVSIDLPNRPTFKFGNNGTRDCISSVGLGIDLGEKSGRLQIHVHAVPNQPVLVSVKALRKLGGVIDCSRDEILYKNVNPKAVVPLEVASSGHCLMALGGDLLAGA